ncbi:MAG: hypothetical protein ABIG92_04740 [Candidatus Omnitrophota bacterium]
MKIDLEKKLSSKIFKLIKTIATIGDKEGIRLYIVGGVVRDILLGVKNLDLDFLVEGDAIAFTESLNKALRGKLTIYKAFNTATLSLKGYRIDFVAARKESYKRPASYPDVEPGTLKDDLHRRDFSINAMAISVNKKDLGRLVDHCDGYKDLRKGIIRVLHEKSFVDDPTRIFRAVRFAVRFGFEIEPETKKLMKGSILGGFLGEVNRGRIKKEIELFLREKDPLKCLESFSKLI